MSRGTLFETLEMRTLMSASVTPSSSTLKADEKALALARLQSHADQLAWAAVKAADKIAIKAHPVKSDPAAADLITAWKVAILTRDNTLATDQFNLKITTNNDKITILEDQENVRHDQADKNTTQLAIDQAALDAAQLKLATDRNTLTDTLENDRITTKATIAADHLAILAKELADGGNAAGIAARQKLVNDSITWVDTLANDQKTIAAEELKVADDLYS